MRPLAISSEHSLVSQKRHVESHQAPNNLTLNCTLQVLTLFGLGATRTRRHASLSMTLFTNSTQLKQELLGYVGVLTRCIMGLGCPCHTLKNKKV